MQSASSEHTFWHSHWPAWLQKAGQFRFSQAALSVHQE